MNCGAIVEAELISTAPVSSASAALFDERAEWALLGDCLLSRDQSSEIVTSLLEGDFTSPRRRAIFLALTERVRVGKPLDAVELISSRVVNQGELATMIDTTPQASNWQIHRDVVRELHQRRLLMGLAENIRHFTASGTATPDQVAQAVWRALGQVSELSPQAMGDPKALLATYAGDLRRWSRLPLVTTGIDRLDQAIGGGIMPHGVMSVVGSEGSMKTSMALKAAETYLRTVGRPVLYLSMDMEGYRVALRRLLPLMNMGEMAALQEMRDDTEDFRDAMTQRQELDAGRFVILDGVMTLGDIQRHIETRRPGLVIWDYLTAVRFNGSEYEKMSAVCDVLRSWKRRYQASWIVLNQMSENAKSAQRQGEAAGRARGGNAVAQLADVVLELFKDTEDPVKSEEPQLFESRPRTKLVATIVKSRYGETGASYELGFRGHCMELTGDAWRVERKNQKKALFASTRSWS